ncbi:MAG: hypothetical protein NTX14_02990 [Candidatus Nealsonbacteria bacterium]|nr:hypothetical protein [Candidatus Nealsonbacteria bacterium]
MDELARDVGPESFDEEFAQRGASLQKILDGIVELEEKKQRLGQNKALILLTMGGFERMFINYPEWVWLVNGDKAKLKRNRQLEKELAEIETRLVEENGRKVREIKDIREFVDDHLFDCDDEFKEQRIRLNIVLEMRNVILCVIRVLELLLEDRPNEEYLKMQWPVLIEMVERVNGTMKRYSDLIGKALEENKIENGREKFSGELPFAAALPLTEGKTNKQEIISAVDRIKELAESSEKILDEQVVLLEESLARYRTAFVQRVSGHAETDKAEAV